MHRLNKNLLCHLIFGKVSFPQSEEFDEFRYKFLVVLMLFGALFTAFFVLGEYAKINRIQTPHLVSMQLFTVCTLLLWLVLRGHKHLFNLAAWTYEIVCLMEYTSSLWLVPADELRLMWFFVNLPGVFILLGASAGWFITVLSIVWLLVSMVYLGAFFHAYGARSLSYFVRMRDYNRELERLAMQS